MPPRRRLKTYCESCNNELLIRNGKYNKRFCSHKCSIKIGSSHPSYKGGRFIGKDGYVRILVEGSGRYVLEHRSIMEKFLGRNLAPDEFVHHIDSNKCNNSLSNLKIMELVAHSNLHKKEYCIKNQRYPFFDKLPSDVSVGMIISVRPMGHRTFIGKICRICGKKFWARKDYNANTCSNSCGHRKLP